VTAASWRGPAATTRGKRDDHGPAHRQQEPDDDAETALLGRARVAQLRPRSEPAPVILTKAARVLLVIAREHDIRLRDIAAQLDLTERAVFAMICELDAKHIIRRTKAGRTNLYTLNRAQRLTRSRTHRRRARRPLHRRAAPHRRPIMNPTVQSESSSSRRGAGPPQRPQHRPRRSTR
jgi:hypothetical protein